jgi:hypothetical protein
MKKLLIGFVIGCLAAGPAVAEDIQSIKNISQELVKIRQQIESLHDQINTEKDSYKDRMRSYANQQSDLDVRISRADLNIKELQRELKKLIDTRNEKTKTSENLVPVLHKSIDKIRQNVSVSLPFKLKERLRALDEIKYRLDAKIISANKAANQLWAFVEDELMLGKSNGIYNDTITINGQEKLVKVLRIGKIAMFYRTSDDEFGVVQKMDGTWKQHAYEDSSNISRLEHLFDSFGKNIRNGQFVTPDFLPRS